MKKKVSIIYPEAFLRDARDAATCVRRAGMKPVLGSFRKAPGSDTLERCTKIVESSHVALALFPERMNPDCDNFVFMWELIVAKRAGIELKPVFLNGMGPSDIWFYSWLFPTSTEYEVIDQANSSKSYRELRESLRESKRTRMPLEILAVSGVLILAMAVVIMIPNASIFALLVSDLSVMMLKLVHQEP